MTPACQHCSPSKLGVCESTNMVMSLAVPAYARQYGSMHDVQADLYLDSSISTKAPATGSSRAFKC
jgi:hypothetical protein